MKNVAYIPIVSRNTIRAWAMIDPEDAVLVAAHRWNLVGEGYGYALIDRRNIPMHRLILGLTPGVGICHHVNEDKLDNRKANLQVFATRAEANSAPHPKRDAASRAYQLGTRADALQVGLAELLEDAA